MARWPLSTTDRGGVSAASEATAGQWGAMPVRAGRLALGLRERQLILALGDGMVLLVALWLTADRAGALRPVGGLSSWEWTLGLVGVWEALALVCGCYSARAVTHPLPAVRSALVAALVSGGLGWLVRPADGPALILTFGWVGLGLAGWRLTVIALLARPAFRRRALIVGARRAGHAIASLLQADRWSGYTVVGFVDDSAEPRGAFDGLPVVGPGADLGALVERLRVDEVVLATAHPLSGEVSQALLRLFESGVPVTLMPHLYERLTGRVPVEHIGDHWVMALAVGGPGPLYRCLRRVEDLVLASLGLVVTAPLWGLIALAIRLDSPGPVFYRQVRVGYRGRPFTMIKFRTMRTDAEKEGRPVWAAANDPRVTGVGRLLRATRLDELPQLLNVLRGEMSLIGPRPERPAFVAMLQTQIPFYRARLLLRPGLTGWAQVNYPYGRTVEDALVKLQYDLYYLKHQSPYLDLLILLRTVVTVLACRGS